MPVENSVQNQALMLLLRGPGQTGQFLIKQSKNNKNNMLVVINDK